jgi:hypothetical protein
MRYSSCDISDIGIDVAVGTSVGSGVGELVGMIVGTSVACTELVVPHETVTTAITTI